MRKLLVILVSVVLSFSAARAQKITGLVKDDLGKGIDKATVSLLRAKDSSVIKLAVSGADGKFSFQTSSGKFLVRVSHVGYAPKYSGIVEVSGDVEVPAIQLAKAAS